MTFVTFQSTHNKTARIAMLLGCLLAGSLGVAQAAVPADEVPTVVVSFGDLDLSTTDGANALYKRISAAAHKVCPFEDSVHPLEVALNNSCRSAAIARAVGKVNNAKLATVWNEHVNRG
jgi:UrcA family protein